jgi:periplasmic divalent cation tolerance protein
MNDVWIVLTTFPDLENARQIGTRLVEEQVAACVNLLPAAESIYRWRGSVETATEIPALIKTTAAGFARLEEVLRRLHPYEVPEIIALPVASGSAPYLEWVTGNVVP